MGKAVLWVLKGEPKNIKITDKDGVVREPDMKKIKAHPTIRGSYIAGRYGKGVGGYLYHTRLGNASQLRAQGNLYTTNDEILEAIGYIKTEVEI